MQTGQATVIEPITGLNRDRDASLASFTAHHLDVISVGRWHGQPKASCFQQIAHNAWLANLPTPVFPGYQSAASESVHSSLAMPTDRL